MLELLLGLEEFLGHLVNLITIVVWTGVCAAILIFSSADWGKGRGK